MRIKSADGGVQPTRDEWACRDAKGRKRKTGDPKVSRFASSSQRWLSASVKEIAVLFNINREIERMLAHELFRQFGVALFQRLDNAQMIDDRARSAVALRNRHAANGAHVHEDVLDGVEDD